MHVLQFPNGQKMHLENFTEKWFGLYKIQFCLPNNIVRLIIVDKFDPNLILVNVNKLIFLTMKHKSHEAQNLYSGEAIVMLILITKKKTMMKNQYTQYKFNILKKGARQLKIHILLRWTWMTFISSGIIWQQEVQHFKLLNPKK